MHDVITRCKLIAGMSEETGCTTRRFLSPPMRAVHRQLRAWMQQAGMAVAIDHVGNIRGLYPADRSSAPRLLIGSHLDTVPNAGAFDGVLGVMLGLALIENLAGRRLPFAIEVIGFSEEEGVRFGAPFIGSRALIGDLDEELLARRDDTSISVHQAIEAFELDPGRIPEARFDDSAFAFLEFHIEQGPVLDSLDLPLGIVDAIAGQSRVKVRFEGQANHAGTTPMHLRRDALSGAAEWIASVEREACAVAGAVATVGQISASPGVGNVIPGSVTLSLDVRHAIDPVRHELTTQLTATADRIAAQRCLTASSEQLLDQPAVAMDPDLVMLLESAVASTGRPVHRMPSGAGHDAMIVARGIPAAMLFLRSPGGISHHPDETVLADDVDAALDAAMRFLEALEQRHA